MSEEPKNSVDHWGRWPDWVTLVSVFALWWLLFMPTQVYHTHCDYLDFNYRQEFEPPFTDVYLESLYGALENTGMPHITIGDKILVPMFSWSNESGFWANLNDQTVNGASMQIREDLSNPEALRWDKFYWEYIAPSDLPRPDELSTAGDYFVWCSQVKAVSTGNAKGVKTRQEMEDARWRE